jgi:hypothetical protein
MTAAETFSLQPDEMLAASLVLPKLTLTSRLRLERLGARFKTGLISPLFTRIVFLSVHLKSLRLIVFSPCHLLKY